METVFLWLVLCLDGPACVNAQVYQMDVFDSPAARQDCDKAADAGAAQMRKSEARNWRLGCATNAEFQARGLGQ